MPDPLLRYEHLDEPLFGHLRRDFTALLLNQTVGSALEHLRAEPLGERIVYFYVVDEDGKLAGVVPTRRLLMAPLDTPLRDIMVGQVVTLPTWATVRDASDLFMKRRLLALPVVDSLGHLHGIADVSMFTGELSGLGEAASHQDIFQLIGVHVSPDATSWRAFLQRFPWLLSNIAGGLIAATVCSFYEPLLDAVIVLALFIPVVLALAESVSVQSVSLTLQSFHGAKVDWPFLRAALGRELLTASLLGLASGGIVGFIAGVWQPRPLVGAAVGGTIALSMVTAALLGVALPGALRALRRDPRIASGPIVLALADLATLLFYFNLAGKLLT
ncbi:MAG TPA: magnesium transporter [Vicinamibacterales bacterium]|nr:magnesium transporter [Vicinamibacterales bacterium]